ncbi:MAG: type IV secretory system conjugative DNA transfer family protein [Bdellovibrionales bacterium]
MVLQAKHYVKHADLLRDARPVSVRIKEFWSAPDISVVTFIGLICVFLFVGYITTFWDIFLAITILYGRWVKNYGIELPFKMPKYASHLPDPHNPFPGKGGAGPSEGILYLGNVDDAKSADHGKEMWLTNSDARTHILYIGTTGSGKTEGLKAIVTNSLAWGSGFVFIDGKADTDLWASLFSLARRFGRDDDLLVLNYMTANSDDGAVSNTMNPFANGSASYLTNMVVSLMPDAGGDNAMWKERAVALMGALMPALTWKRDKGGLLLDVGVLRDYIELPAIIKLSRDEALPERILHSLTGYLNTLPGYIDEAFDDEGREKPPSPDQPMYDLQVARQQHGYLSMQFTRALQSLADEYGYIFKAQLADVDVLDVVLNRRILVGLIPSLEKSGDEAANLGKIVAASLKGMMGATLGNTVEGSWEQAIGSKQTRSQSSFMAVFDEVGYYTAQGMAVMAAQARSLGFSLIFAAQDLPSMEKRVKQEAQSILANCNMKIFGKLEDPGDTKKFFQEHVGTGFVFEGSGMQQGTNTISSLFVNKPFYEQLNTSGIQLRVRADYDHLRGQREGEAHLIFSDYIARGRIFYAQPERVKALRVHKLLPVPATTTITEARNRTINEVAGRLKDPDWNARDAVEQPVRESPEITRLAEGLKRAKAETPLRAAIAAVGGLSGVAPSAPKTTTTAPSAPEGTLGGMPAVPQKVSLPVDAAATRVPETAGKAQPVTMSASRGKGKQSTQEQSPVSVDVGRVLSTVSTEGAPKDIDINVIPRIEVEADGEDITKLKLSDDVSSMIESMADKLNKGLGVQKAEGKEEN